MLHIGLSLQEMRQVNQAEKSSAHQCQGSEQTEVAQQVGTSEYQSQKCPDGRKTAYRQRVSDFFNQLLHRGYMILMRQHMDGIAECDTHHRRAGSYGNS